MPSAPKISEAALQRAAALLESRFQPTDTEVPGLNPRRDHGYQEAIPSRAGADDSPSPKAVASASIAQVHRATPQEVELPPTFPSRVVAVKVRRPGIANEGVRSFRNARGR
jgi:predicted unusual protein kinase regulating ubiquinone biosynthesis (AarF/ABC1/UbiB family)